MEKNIKLPLFNRIVTKEKGHNRKKKMNVLENNRKNNKTPKHQMIDKVANLLTVYMAISSHATSNPSALFVQNYVQILPENSK